MKGAYVLMLMGLCAAAAYVLPMGLVSSAAAKDTMEVVRDKDKTVYTIDSDDRDAREEARDKERAWQMLQNGNFIIDGRDRRKSAQSADK